MKKETWKRLKRSYKETKNHDFRINKDTLRNCELYSAKLFELNDIFYTALKEHFKCKENNTYLDKHIGMFYIIFFHDYRAAFSNLRYAFKKDYKDVISECMLTAEAFLNAVHKFIDTKDMSLIVVRMKNQKEEYNTSIWKLNKKGNEYLKIPLISKGEKK